MLVTDRHVIRQLLPVMKFVLGSLFITNNFLFIIVIIIIRLPDKA